VSIRIAIRDRPWISAYLRSVRYTMNLRAETFVLAMSPFSDAVIGDLPSLHNLTRSTQAMHPKSRRVTIHTLVSPMSLTFLLTCPATIMFPVLSIRSTLLASCVLILTTPIYKSLILPVLMFWMSSIYLYHYFLNYDFIDTSSVTSTVPYICSVREQFFFQESYVK